MIKSFMLSLVCIIFLISGCSTFETDIDNSPPKFSIDWAYEAGKIEFTVWNLSLEDVLVEFPLAEKYNTAKILDYEIYNDDDDNFQKTQTCCDFPLFRGYDYRIMYAALGKGKTLGGTEYTFKVPSLTKKFEDIRRIELHIAAVPINQLSNAKNASSFKELFYKNEQTYIVDFTQIGYKEKKGEMELESEWKQRVKK